MVKPCEILDEIEAWIEASQFCTDKNFIDAEDLVEYLNEIRAKYGIEK